MKTHRRYWVFFMLFLFSGIAYLDRVNMSVAGKPIAGEFGLSPIALGYLFSSFLWAYVLMMLPGGRLIDRWGTHVMAPIAVAVWSAAQMATGMVGNFATMLVARLRPIQSGPRSTEWLAAQPSVKSRPRKIGLFSDVQQRVLSINALGPITLARRNEGNPRGCPNRRVACDDCSSRWFAGITIRCFAPTRLDRSR
jgi:MFS family permease